METGAKLNKEACYAYVIEWVVWVWLEITAFWRLCNLTSFKMAAAAIDPPHAAIDEVDIVVSSLTHIEKNFSSQKSKGNINALHICKFIISKIGTPQFNHELVRLFQDFITTVAEKNYKSKSAIRAKLWHGFHMMRTRNYTKLNTLWAPMTAASAVTGLNFEDPLMEQSLYQEVFQKCVCFRVS